MASATFLAALFAFVAVLGTSTFLVVRALHAWRSFRSFARTAGAALDGVTRAADAAEQHAAAAVAHAEQLATATAHLQRSLARLALLQSAAGEFSSTVARLRGAVPRK